MEKKIKKIKQSLIPKPDSHKGQNGKVLVIGGSSLFHSASIWAAEVASYFVDIVHYSSTVENNKVFLLLKKKFHNGIIVEQKNILDYVVEDDAILVGPGMIRSEKRITNYELRITNFNDVLKINDEGEYTYYLTKYLIENFPEKKFVFDAGVLQMMDSKWLLKLKTPAIITPHQNEFEQLFGQSIKRLDQEGKLKLVEETAKKYNVVILLKAIDDIISDGITTEIIKGGNQGLTKGGTGDLLAGLTSSFFTKSSALDSGLMASWLLKKSAEALYPRFGYWYNVDRLVEIIPQTFSKI